ncbi:tRNA (N(6)-L-threonylcarbamoyladenosine(37)-C(2))-methylthiotransferase MtaB [Mollicutes bacterium LVI A0039]|nr:tRNA (N(6)-L-threonylcarbamoyladenosine(37)-C(2))-methylthiotransferase MtaB [Mollicutes bacterium LVI A0039]
MKKIAIKTLGCKVNTYESESIWQLFAKEGYTRVEPDQFADVYVINTCTVTNSGDRKSRQAIRKVIRQNPEAVTVVIGCYAQMAPEDIEAIEGVDIVLGTQGREKLVEYVRNFQNERAPITNVENIIEQKQFEGLEISGFESQTRAFLKIQEGCNNFCSFCIIPWARGLMRSQDPKLVISQIETLVAKGVKEVVLTGIHTAGYGEDFEDYNFADLLRDIDQIAGLERIRISSIEISQITPEVLEVMRNSTKLADHLHVPIQAGHNQILTDMRRHYTVEEFKAHVDKLRAIFPSISLTTDIIVGFPGETDEMFAETIDNLRAIGFNELHVFPYSKRNGTPAAKMPNQVADDVKKARVHRLIELNDELAIKYSQLFTGDIVDVLVERVNKNGLLEGHTSNYIKVQFNGSEKLIGSIVSVVIKDSNYPLNNGEIV